MQTGSEEDAHVRSGGMNRATHSTLHSGLMQKLNALGWGLTTSCIPAMNIGGGDRSILID